jgi:hypothetical protein
MRMSRTHTGYPAIVRIECNILHGPFVAFDQHEKGKQSLQECVSLPKDGLENDYRLFILSIDVQRSIRTPNDKALIVLFP